MRPRHAAPRQIQESREEAFAPNRKRPAMLLLAAPLALPATAAGAQAPEPGADPAAVREAARAAGLRSLAEVVLAEVPELDPFVKGEAPARRALVALGRALSSLTDERVANERAPFDPLSARLRLAARRSGLRSSSACMSRRSEAEPR